MTARPRMSTETLEKELAMKAMTKREILKALDVAGEALKATGEKHIVLSWSYGSYGVLLLEGREHFHGSGETPTAAFVDACAKRSDGERERAIREQVEAEVRARLAA